MNIDKNSCVIWLMGLSASGKTTIANELISILSANGKIFKSIDGDDFRRSHCNDLGFTERDRCENIRRAAEYAKEVASQGKVVLCAFMTPLHSHQELVKSILGESLFLVFINTSLDECIKRDPKGLYHKAKLGEVSNLSGVDSPFELPLKANLELDTIGSTAYKCAITIYSSFFNTKRVS